jgi:transcription antitermination protein NusB
MSRRPHPSQRSAARLGAVQALYQMDLAGSDVSDTLEQFTARATGENFDDGQCGEADTKFLREIVDGAVREQRTIDPFVDALLDKDWPLQRLDSTVRAILRAAAFEMMFMERVPSRVSISEYVDVAGAFFGEEERGFINAVLDSLARKRRPEEFAA